MVLPRTPPIGSARPPPASGEGRAPARRPTDVGGRGPRRPPANPKEKPPWQGPLDDEENESPERAERTYTCKMCQVQMPATEQAAHHRPRPQVEGERGHPCEMVKCGLCRTPFIRGLAKEHKQTCAGFADKSGGGSGGGGSGAAERAIPKSHVGGPKIPRDAPPARPAPSAAPGAAARGAVGRRSREASREPPSTRASREREPPSTGARGGGAGGLGAGAGAGGGVNLNATINRAACFVGDRVLVKQKLAGTVMHVGPIEGLPGMEVGVKLDEPVVNAGDGKTPAGIRYFRCQGGHGLFVSMMQVQPLPASMDVPRERSRPNSQSNSRCNSRDPSPTPPAARAPAAKAGAGAAARPPIANTGPAKKRNEKWEKQLYNLVGMAGVKDKVSAIRNSLEVNQRRQQAGGSAERPQNVCIMGNPGSGRTVLARVVGQMLAAHDGTRMRNKLVFPQRQDVMHAHSISRTQELLEKVLKDAKGAVLVVDDMSAVAAPSGSEAGGVSSTGKELLELFAQEVAKANKEAKDAGMVLIVTGDTTTMSAALRACPSLRSLLGNVIDIPDLSALEVVELMAKFATERGFLIDDKVRDSKAVSKYFTTALARADKEHRNCHLAMQALEETIRRQTARVHACGTMSKASLLTLMEADVLAAENDDASAVGARERQLEASIAELDEVVGLEAVKDFVKGMRAQITLDSERRAAGLPSIGQGTLHMVFSGNPGTGKTTVARIVAQMFGALGVLRKGQLVEVERSMLVAGYSGQTAIKTKDLVESALGGVLFVDEAYTLVNGDRDAFGKEALDTILKMMEDFRDDLVVIFAGYSAEMGTLMHSNSGLASRFPNWLEFQDYTSKELSQIALKMLKASKMKLDPKGQEVLSRTFDRMEREAREAAAVLKAQAESEGDNRDRHAPPAAERPGNGRAVRNLLEQIQRKQALRLQDIKGPKSFEDLVTIKEADVVAASR